MNTDKKYTVVVGAGLTGLSAAWKLASHGLNCLLLEQDSSPGGMARTLKLDDILFDLGPHFIFSDKNSPGGLLIHDLLAYGNIISREFRYTIITNLHHFKMPIKGDIINYPTRYKKQILLNILTGSKSKAPRTSLMYFIESKFGTLYYQEVFKNMILKKTGMEGHDLHVDWYIRPERDYQNNREILPYSASILKRILQPLKTFFSTNKFCYPKEGFGFLADQLHKKYQSAGGITYFNCGNIDLTYSDNRITSCRLKGNEYPVQDIVWTGSSNGLFSSLSENVYNVTVPQIETIILLLTFEGKRLKTNPYSYTYNTDTNIIFNREYSPENIFQKYSPANKEGLCLEINHFNSHEKAIESMTDADIVQQALGDVELLGYFKKNNLRHCKLIRLKGSLPVYDLDYEKKLALQNSKLEKFKNLYAVGRTGGAFFCMSPAAVNQGLKTAQFILDKNQCVVPETNEH